MKKPKPLSKYGRLRSENEGLRHAYQDVYHELRDVERRVYHEARERFEAETAVLQAHLRHMQKMFTDMTACQPLPIVIMTPNKGVEL